MQLNDFDYKLPKELIAQTPPKNRGESRLLVVNGTKLEDKSFSDILNYLSKDDVLVINETKVLKCRLIGKKETGSNAIVILEEKIKDSNLGVIYKCKIKTAKPRVGQKILFGKESVEIVNQNEDDFFIKPFKDFEEYVKKHASYPLPFYVKGDISDEERYQTVFSKKEGSYAAPTAGLHFNQGLIRKIEEKGVKIARVCLHVGFGTFLPIRENDFRTHKMHFENYSISKADAEIINNRKGKLIVVGTTSVRTIESANVNGKIIAGEGETDIFIYPGYEFKNKIDMMITNFHLPKSSLLLLVSAYYGKDNILKAYGHAVKEGYRFFSFGDAMLLIK